MEEFQQLEAQMKVFLLTLDREINQKKSKALDDKNDYVIRINNLKTEEQNLEETIATLQLKEKKTKESLQTSIESLGQQRTKVDGLSKKQDELIEHKNELQAHITELTQQIEASNKEFNQIEKNLTNQVRKDNPDLIKFERYLGLRVEALSLDSLKFIFINVDQNNIDKEYSIEVDVSSDLYKVGKSDPDLGEHVVKELEDEFNEHKELVRFLKSVRNLFRNKL